MSDDLQTAPVALLVLVAEVVLVRLVPQLAQDWPQLAPDSRRLCMVNHLIFEAEDVIVENVWGGVDGELGVRVLYPLDIHTRSDWWHLWLRLCLESLALLLSDLSALRRGFTHLLFSKLLQLGQFKTHNSWASSIRGSREQLRLQELFVGESLIYRLRLVLTLP